MRRKQKKKVFRLPLGVTLIEVLAAMVIIGMVLLIAVPKYTSQLNSIQNKGDEANVQLLQGAARQFKLDTGIWPGILDYLIQNPAAGIPGWSGPYLENIPSSPSGKAYDIDSTNGKVYIR